MNINNKYQELQIGSMVYSRAALLQKCDEVINGNHPSWEKQLYTFIQEWFLDNPFIVVQTSGSTGNPKTVQLSKDNMILSALRTGIFFNLKKGDKALLCLPVDFVAGKMMVVRAIVLGLNLIPVEPKGIALDNIHEDFQFAAMTPMQVFNTLSEEYGILKLNRIKNLIIGGGQISPALFEKLKPLKTEVYHTYGMTETYTHIAVKKVSRNQTESCFFGLPGVSFTKNENNCLVINDAILGIQDLQTNDIVNLISETKIDFEGRYDNVINSGGIKISPEKIEHQIEAYVHDRFIVGAMPDEKLGEKLVLVIESEDKGKYHLQDILDLTGLRAWEKPKKIIYMAVFPETKNGKINRKKLIEKLTN
ncbi:MAG: AMP-binding protein [Bacteroidales bacterium]|nr:AMP-binding protein [Bacteroidales bacterium]MCF8402602.1 AMP-binding protein [Bacteroidales bacterium]